ncbi:MAG TPA: phosphoesterase [Candidatus Dormibacteraeota bacterium]|nr:phosphoesterase [Candidatus Dormibacteraeota bacterium]
MAHRIFFSVDVHGNTMVWRKWLSAVQYYQVNTLMLCGDLTGKMLVPLIKQHDGSYEVRFFQQKNKVKNEQEYKVMVDRIENSGNYPFDATPEEIEVLRKSKDKVDALMKQSIMERIKKWCELAVEKLDLKKTQLIMMPGNDDIKEVDSIIKSYEDKGIVYPLDKIVQIGGVDTLSFEYVNPSPWDTPRELSESDMTKRIDEIASKLSDPRKSIFNFHCPPYGTKIDMAPQLDKSLKPVTEGGAVVFAHCGSKAVLEALKKYQPMIGLHGHIHEAGATDKVGETPVVNPGSEYGEGMIRGIIIDIEDGKVAKHWRVEG